MLSKYQFPETVLKEANRLVEDEKVLDLAKNKKFDELKKVEINIGELVEYFQESKRWYDLTSSQISNQRILPIIMIARAVYRKTRTVGISFDYKMFIEELVDETGDMGKSLAVWMWEGSSIYRLNDETFFSDKRACEYVPYDEDGDN